MYIKNERKNTHTRERQSGRLKENQPPTNGQKRGQHNQRHIQCDSYDTKMVDENQTRNCKRTKEIKIKSN